MLPTHTSPLWAAAGGLALAALVLPAPVAIAASTDETPTTEAAPSEEAEAAPQHALMAALSAAGVGKTLEEANIHVFGYAEGSYTRNFDHPDSGENFGRLYDSKDNAVLLNQLSLAVERPVDPSKMQFDIGGRMQWVFGSDAGFMHANGLFDWYDGPLHPENQVDLFQAYLDFAIPVGNGLLVRAGKFAALPGYESIEPVENDLFSHSYLFNFTEPSTATGVLATYAFTDALSLTTGITRGWDQATEDNNGAIDSFSSLDWTISKATSLTVALSVGPQRPDDSQDYRTSVDVVLGHDLTEKLNVGFHGNFGHDPSATDDGEDAFWYGAAGYATYTLNSYLSLNARVEWFRDEEGFLTGVAANYYEMTIGLGIHPLPNDRWGQFLIIHPELRGDFSGDRVFNDGDDHQMVTAAVDMIYSF